MLVFLFGIYTPLFAESEKWKELRNLPFPENYPTKETTDRLYDEMLFHRATQVVLWSLPAMALWAMKKGSEAQFGEGSQRLPDLEGPAQRGDNRKHAELRCDLRHGLS